MKKREKIESHLAGCYHCLDKLAAIHDGLKFIKRKSTKRRRKMKREDLILFMAVISFIGSFIFRGYFLQFLAATILLGIKWIVDTKSNKMLIMVYDAWKRGGESEAGRVLKDIETRERIDL